MKWITIKNETPYSWKCSSCNNKEPEVLDGYATKDLFEIPLVYHFLPYPGTVETSIYLKYGDHSDWDLQYEDMGSYIVRESDNQKQFELVKDSFFGSQVVDRCPNFGLRILGMAGKQCRDLDGGVEWCDEKESTAFWMQRLDSASSFVDTCVHQSH